MIDASNEIFLEDVTKMFTRGRQQVHALRSVSLRVRRGEFVAIMGPSGSGKTTLLQLIGGLDSVTSGVIRVAGQHLDQLDEASLARYRLSSVGHVFQFFNLMPTLTALENTALPLLLSNASRKQALERAEALLVELNLADRLDHVPSELSGGELQRISMARALMTDPPVILADEPTGTLDSYAAEEVMRLLSSMAEQKQKTLLMVTHDAKAAAYADRIVRLKEGYLATEDTARETPVFH